MKNKGQKNERTTRLKSMILLVAFTAIMLIVSTYAWFSTQRAVSISNITGEVKVAEGLEISLDAKNWSEAITLTSTTLTNVSDADTVGTYSTGANHQPSELKPASTIGASGNSIVKLYSGTFDGSTLSNITQCDETKAGTSSDNDFAGYYAFDVFLRNSSQSTTAQALKLSAGSYANVLDAGTTGSGNSSSITGDGSTGLQNTVRVAFAKYSATASVNADQTTILDTTVGALPEGTTEVTAATRTRSVTTSQVAIWEPNANFHVDYMVSNASRFGFTGAARDKLVNTMAINDVVSTDNIKVYNSADTGYTTRLTQQKTTQTSVEVPATAGQLPTSYATAAATTLTDTANTPTTFAITGNAVSRLRIYVWLEGQDVDCVNYASHGGGIEVKIGLEKE